MSRVCGPRLRVAQSGGTLDRFGDMPDRLAELRRQRALIAEHLAWLDRQIAEAGGSSVPAAQPALQPTPTPATPLGPTPLPKVEPAAVVAAALKASAAAAANPPEAPEVTAKANAILDEYRQPD